MDGSNVIFAISVSSRIGYYCFEVVSAMSISSVIGASRSYDNP